MKPACRCPWHWTEELGGQPGEDACPRALIELIEEVKAAPVSSWEEKRAEIVRQRRISA